MFGVGVRIHLTKFWFVIQNPKQQKYIDSGPNNHRMKKL